MSQLKPFSLRIFVADGDPDGLRLVERTSWVGKAIVFPRALLPKIKHRDELSQQMKSAIHPVRHKKPLAEP